MYEQITYHFILLVKSLHRPTAEILLLTFLNIPASFSGDFATFVEPKRPIMKKKVAQQIKLIMSGCKLSYQ